MNYYEINLLKSEFGNRVTDYYVDILKNYHLYTVDKFDNTGKSIFETALILDYNVVLNFNRNYDNKNYFIIGEISNFKHAVLCQDNQVLIYDFQKDVLDAAYLNVYSYLNQIKDDYKLTFKTRILNYLKFDGASLLNKSYTIPEKFIMYSDFNCSIMEISKSALTLLPFKGNINSLSELPKLNYTLNIKYKINENLYFFNGLFYFVNGKVFSNYNKIELYVKPEEIFYIKEHNKFNIFIFTKQILYCINLKHEFILCFDYPSDYKIYYYSKNYFDISNYIYGFINYFKFNSQNDINPKIRYLVDNIELLKTDFNTYMTKFRDYYIKGVNPRTYGDIVLYKKIHKYSKIDNESNSRSSEIKSVLNNKLTEDFWLIVIFFLLKFIFKSIEYKLDLNLLSTLFKANLFIVLLFIFRMYFGKMVLAGRNFLYFYIFCFGLLIESILYFSH